MFESCMIVFPADMTRIKHVLCDFCDDDIIKALSSFKSVLLFDGKVVIIDAILLDGPEAFNQEQAQVLFHLLLMLVNSNCPMESLVLEWNRLAQKAGFIIDEIISTTSFISSFNITILS